MSDNLTYVDSWPGEIKLNALRQALKEGEKSGFVDYSLKELIEELDTGKNRENK